ncbi:MAG: CCA tRNA nucleotidyltransferase [Candidatus Andersenbacteria bacterium]
MHLPAEVQSIITTLHQAGFEAYAVGGCVRDLLLHREPKDWDVTTKARPEEIQKLFPQHFYTNRFGTVTVLTASKHAALAQVEVTTYRIDGNYSDQRHPDEVRFSTTLEEDLARRDFTINAIALDENTVIDPFQGQADLEQGIIRAVGEASERFQEDALRMLRAIRLASQLDYTIAADTLQAIAAGAATIAAVSPERVRDEFLKIVMSDYPEKGFNLLQATGLLPLILPELAEGVGVKQNKHHIYTVFEHNIKSLQFAAQYNYSLSVRLAALLHDVGKPRTRRRRGNDYTFYAHEIVGARMAEKLLQRLRLPREVVQQVTHLVRHHMFYYDVGRVTEAGMRRLLHRVGRENFADLIKVRIAERKGSGVPKAEPYRLRHLQFMAEKVSRQAVTVAQLAVNGTDLIQELHLKPGPQIGGILNALLAEVLDNPVKNERSYLLQRARELITADPETLKALGEKARDEEETKRDETIRRKYHV